MIERKSLQVNPTLNVEQLCFMMDSSEGESVSVYNDEGIAKWHCRRKRYIKKKITLVYLMKVICASRETCLEWLKNRGLIPRIMFCPCCSRKMKFETCEDALDGYVWICRECSINPPQFSIRHGSWLETKDVPLLDILLFTYLWSHGFTEEQISKETNMSLDNVKEWFVVFSHICDSLHQKNLTGGDHKNENNLEERDSHATIWKRKNKHKDPFLEFLKDADTL